MTSQGLSDLVLRFCGKKAIFESTKQVTYELTFENVAVQEGPLKPENETCRNRKPRHASLRPLTTRRQRYVSTCEIAMIVALKRRH